jgi:hypothetical protein
MANRQLPHPEYESIVRFNVTNVDDEESIQTNDSKLERSLFFSDPEDPQLLTQFDAASCQIITYDMPLEPRSRA